MKIIDSKGKLFGLINIIDAGVIILLMVLIFGGAYRLSGSPGNKVVNTEQILVEALVEDVGQLTVNAIAVGDRTLDPTSREEFGEIIEIYTQPHQKAVQTSDGKIVMAEVPKRYDLIITLKSNANVSSDEINVASYALRVGTRVVLQTRDYSVTATVRAVEITE